MMFFIVLACSLAPVARADEKSDKLRKEIADLRVALKAKENELARREPTKEVSLLFSDLMQMNTAGQFGIKPNEFANLSVIKVIDESRMLLQVGDKEQNKRILNRGKVLVVNIATADYADGQAVDNKLWFRFLGNTKYDGVTYQTVEPYVPRGPKQPDKKP